MDKCDAAAEAKTGIRNWGEAELFVDEFRLL